MSDGVENGESKEHPVGRGKGHQDHGAQPAPTLRDRWRCGEGFSGLHPSVKGSS